MSNSLKCVLLTYCAVICVCSAQFTIGGSQQQQQSQSQYPRIKIGGPLGQLIPGGINLGSGFGSMLNQLLSSASGSSSGGGAESSSSGIQIPGLSTAASSPYVNAMRGYGGFAPNSPYNALSAYNSPQSLYGSASSPYAGLESGSFYGGQGKYPGSNPFGASFSPYSSSLSESKS